MSLALTASGFVVDADVSPLRPAENAFDARARSMIYKALKLTTTQRESIEESIALSGSRKVGKGALKNVIAHLPERKCRGPRCVVESSTVELYFAYLMELEADVLAYYPQAPITEVIRERPGRRRHTSHATVDFLVFRKASISFVETKSCTELENLVRDSDSGWNQTDSGWTHQPIARRIAEMGVGFEVFAPPALFGFALQSLEAMASVVDETPGRPAARLVERALAEIRRAPLTVKELVDCIPGFSPRLALWMLSQQRAFGLLRSRSFSNPEEYVLFHDKEEAVKADEALHSGLTTYFEQPELEYGYLTGRASDKRVADRRQARLDAIATGESEASSYYDRLAKISEKASKSGIPPLDALLGGYRNSGNTRSRLSKITNGIINKAIEEEWNKGKCANLADLHLKIEKKCKRRNQRPPSYRTVRVRVRKMASPARRALNTGGLRAYAAIRERTDHSCVSLAPIGFLHTLVVDSSDFDLKVRPQALLDLLPEKPRFYVGIDGCSGKPVAHALVFGAARTDALAILLREFVKRHGRLPHVIQLDRGPENTSNWMKEFCRINRIVLKYPPTAGSAWNGTAENAIGQTNSRVAHKLRGNTKNDAMGRKVDGRFKSKHHATHSFETASDLLTEFLYGTYCETPGQDDLSPNEREEKAKALLGTMGYPRAFDTAFAIQTSIPIAIRKRIRFKEGVWWNYAIHTSAPFLKAIRSRPVEELRSDCVDPAVIYARVAGRWYSLFHRTALQFAEASATQKLSRLLEKPSRKAVARARKTEQGRKLERRIQNAERAAEATKHLHPTHSKSPEQGRTRMRALPTFPWSRAKAISG